MNKPHARFHLLRKACILPLLILLLLMFTGPGFSAESDQQRFAKTLFSLHDAVGGKVIAEVWPGTPLRVLSQKGDNIEVEVTGWSPVGGEQYLFKEMVPKRTVIAEKDDYYESTWQNASIKGWISSADTSDSVHAVWKEASTLFHQRCTRCHALHRPTEFTANQWPSILKIMTVRAGLSAGNKALVTKFLQVHAKDQEPITAEDEAPATETAQASPPVPPITGDAKLAAEGGKLFQAKSCFACHGADARTPAIPLYPRLAGQSADYAYKQMRDFKSGLRSNDDFKVMREIMAQISDDEMRAIAYWLSTQ